MKLNIIDGSCKIDAVCDELILVNRQTAETYAFWETVIFVASNGPCIVFFIKNVLIV